MTILLLILKIIGILLLVILGVVFLVLFYLLVLPITYRVFGAYAGKYPEAFVCVYDPLRLVYFKYIRDHDGSKTVIKILWGLIKSQDDDGADVKAEDELVDKTDGEAEVPDTKIGEASDIEEEKAETEEASDIEEEKFESEEATDIEEEKVESEEQSDNVDEIDSCDKFSEELDSFTEFEDKDFDEEFERNIKRAKDSDKEESSIDKYKNILSDESNQQAVLFLLEKLFKLLNRVKPKIKSCDVDFSVGEPYRTGQITGMVAMFPVSYTDNVNINPDFTSENPYINGHIHMKGRVQLLFVLAYGIMIILNKDCRRLYNQIRG